MKLDNVLVGFKDPTIIYLIDFGISSVYLDEEGNHIEKVLHNTFTGNFLFASLNSCCRIVQSRRDDIQSLFYMMIYLLNDNRLPWSNFA